MATAFMAPSHGVPSKGCSALGSRGPESDILLFGVLPRVCLVLGSVILVQLEAKD